MFVLVIAGFRVGSGIAGLIRIKLSIRRRMRSPKSDVHNFVENVDNGGVSSFRSFYSKTQCTSNDVPFYNNEVLILTANQKILRFESRTTCILHVNY